MLQNNANIEGDEIVIRVHKDTLVYALQYYNDDMVLVDADLLLRDICAELNNERHGDNPIVRMLDEALEDAINNGSEGVDYPGFGDVNE